MAPYDWPYANGAVPRGGGGGDNGCNTCRPAVIEFPGGAPRTVCERDAKVPGVLTLNCPTNGNTPTAEVATCLTNSRAMARGATREKHGRGESNIADVNDNGGR